MSDDGSVSVCRPSKPNADRASRKPATRADGMKPGESDAHGILIGRDVCARRHLPGMAIVAAEANLEHSSEEGRWLDPRVANVADVLPCLRPLPAERMEAYAVSPLVSSPRNNGPELIVPVTGS